MNWWAAICAINKQQLWSCLWRFTIRPYLIRLQQEHWSYRRLIKPINCIVFWRNQINKIVWEKSFSEHYTSANSMSPSRKIVKQSQFGLRVRSQRVRKHITHLNDSALKISPVIMVGFAVRTSSQVSIKLSAVVKNEYPLETNWSQ